eukprot:1150198-Pelagomonas_calceolata.AAC.2
MQFTGIKDHDAPVNPSNHKSHLATGIQEGQDKSRPCRIKQGCQTKRMRTCKFVNDSHEKHEQRKAAAAGREFTVPLTSQGSGPAAKLFLCRLHYFCVPRSLHERVA